MEEVARPTLAQIFGRFYRRYRQTPSAAKPQPKDARTGTPHLNRNMNSLFSRKKRKKTKRRGQSSCLISFAFFRSFRLISSFALDHENYKDPAWQSSCQWCLTNLRKKQRLLLIVLWSDPRTAAGGTVHSGVPHAGDGRRRMLV
jgi:hypothetical protein